MLLFSQTRRCLCQVLFSLCIFYSLDVSLSSSCSVDTGQLGGAHHKHRIHHYCDFCFLPHGLFVLPGPLSDSSILSAVLFYIYSGNCFFCEKVSHQNNQTSQVRLVTPTVVTPSLFVVFVVFVVVVVFFIFCVSVRVSNSIFFWDRIREKYSSLAIFLIRNERAQKKID